MSCDSEKCDSCGKCRRACHIRINPAKQPNSPECVRCGKCVSVCEKGAMAISVFVKPGAENPPKTLERK